MSTNKNEALKACPFCGIAAEYMATTGGWMAGCPSQDPAHPYATSGNVATKQEAAGQWNMRALATPDPEPDARLEWPNGCDKTAPGALRYLAKYPRPSGGEQTYNSEHLLQIASEIERTALTPAPSSRLTQTVEWISVEERLPELYQRVLQSREDGQRSVGYLASGGVWYYSPHKLICEVSESPVTHWMEPIKSAQAVKGDA